jgi:ABC-type taurine transport system substrate-binding protein
MRNDTDAWDIDPRTTALRVERDQLAAAHQRSLDHLERALATLDRQSDGPGAAGIFNDARAFLVEQGRAPAVLAEYRAAYVAWEERRR